MSERLVILAGEHDTTPMVYNRLAQHFTVVGSVVETPVSGWQVIKRRAKRLGWTVAFGQGLFVKLVMPLLRYEARRRVPELQKMFDLDPTPIPPDQLRRVDSVNAPAGIAAVQALQPTHIVVNGTRLLSKQFLVAFPDVPIINLHLGINPRYRGGNGGYWALVNHEREHCGVTVHLIDEGVDTGGVLARGLIAPTDEDNFVTYPYHQLARGLELLVDELERGALRTTNTSAEPSAMWYHPTLWQYCYHRFVTGVR